MESEEAMAPQAKNMLKGKPNPAQINKIMFIVIQLRMFFFVFDIYVSFIILTKHMDHIICDRMLLIYANAMFQNGSGKATQYQGSSILVPLAMSVPISSREMCRVSDKYPCVFARMNDTSPLSGTEDLWQMKQLCPELKHADRTTFTTMRLYAATVTRVIMLWYPLWSIIQHIYILFITSAYHGCLAIIDKPILIRN